MRVREVSETDLEAVTRSAQVLASSGMGSDALRLRLDQILAAPGHKIWVCELGEKVVGWVHAVYSYRLTA